MRIQINIDMDNAAFEDNQEELKFVLQQVIAAERCGARAGKLKDSNGNRVGKWAIYEGDEE